MEERCSLSCVPFSYVESAQVGILDLSELSEGCGFQFLGSLCPVFNSIQAELVDLSGIVRDHVQVVVDFLWELLALLHQRMFELEHLLNDFSWLHFLGDQWLNS